MRLTTLSDNTLLIEQYMQSSRTILRESCDGLTLQQRTVVENIYNEFVPLIEASLTADQIKGIFQQVEKQSVEGGQNRTLVGKGVDVAKQANEIINKLGAQLQNTAPVKAFDQKFENLKAKINQKFPDSKLLDGISNLAVWVEKNPGKSAAVIGILTAIASLAAGPVGGAIAGQVLKGAQELLKGEKLSTAIGKGAKAAALGWLTGKAVEFIGNALSDPVMAHAREMGNGIVKANYKSTISEIGGEFGNRFGTFTTGELYGKASDVADIKEVWSAGVKAWKEGDYLRADAMFKSAANMTSELSKPEYVQALADTASKAQSMAAAATEMKNFFGAMSTVAQGAATGAASSEPAKESLYIQDRPLSEGQVYMLFDRIITEAGIMDKIKSGVEKVAGAAVKGAQWAGKQATEKVTSAKLLAAWKMKGSPTDSDQIFKFLKDQGVEDQIISTVFKGMKLPAPAANQPQTDQPAVTQMSYAEVKKQISQLDKKGRQRILAYLQKQLGTV